MGKYLDIIRRAEKDRRHETNEFDEITHSVSCVASVGGNQQSTLFRQTRLFRTFQELERRCPDRIGLRDWKQAIEDGRAFLARWGEQAEALGWTPRDLFGLHPVPGHEATTYRRLSRYDETGLVWLLRGRPVVAMTESTAAIQNPTGSILTYRKHNKPALGPVGDSLDDLK